MRIVDAHVHTLGHESGEGILAALDRVSIDGICLLSPPALDGAPAQHEALRFMRRVTAVDPDRLFGYFWLNPLLPEAVSLVEEAAATPGIRAFKLMSDHWYPHDDRLRPVLGAIEASGLPTLFHAGILWSHMDSSRFCRPADFEVLLHFPKLRFTLAHMAWPWVDECFAVAARMRDGLRALGVGENTMYVDLSPGTPMEIREEAIRRALLIGDTSRLLFGSDDSEPESLEKAARILAFDRDVLTEKVGVDPDTVHDIFGGNVLRFLGANT